MGSPRVYEEVIDGRLVVARPRRDHVEVKVYTGPTPAKGEEPVGDWVMPVELRHVLYVAAAQAALQTPKEKGR